MSMSVIQWQQAIERAEREGRQGDVGKLRYLLAEVTGEGATNTAPGHAYTVQDGDDVFGISEMLLGSIDYVPDLLAANPDTNFATGNEVLVPDIGSEKVSSAASDAAALGDLFETKGPPNDNWTVEDYALLEKVQAQVIEKGGGSGGGGEAGEVQNGQTVEEEEQEAERIPSSAADFELPAEDAEVIARFIAQMIANEVVPDAGASGPQGGDVRRNREVITEGDLGGGDEVNGQDLFNQILDSLGIDQEQFASDLQMNGSGAELVLFADEGPFGNIDIIAMMDHMGREGHENLPLEQLLQDYLVSLVIPGSGPSGDWSADDWAIYDSDQLVGGETKPARDRFWKGNFQFEGDQDAGLQRFQERALSLSSFYNDDETDDFVRAFALVWGGVPYEPNWISAALSVAGGPSLSTLYEGESGFAEGYLDSIGNDTNPSHHYAAMVFLGYFSPFVEANALVNFARDFDNPGDIRIGVLGLFHGLLLKELSNEDDFVLQDVIPVTLNQLSEEPSWLGRNFRGPGQYVEFFREELGKDLSGAR